MSVYGSGRGRKSRLLHDGILGGGNLRAAVLGVNDGLVSNFSLVMGVAGGTDDPTIVLLAGLAGLLAGAFSMAAGEYISVGSQRDVYRFQIRAASERLHRAPQVEETALAEIYEAKGLTSAESRAVANRLMQDPEVALDTKVREELGLDPDALGSPYGAAASSFTAFTFGASVPILPYLFATGPLTLPASATLSACALALVGAVVAVGSGRNPFWGGAKMLLFGGLAAAVTFMIGRLIGFAIIG